MSTKYRLVREVKLKFFEDRDTGEHGLTHAETLNYGFNAFFDGIGIFHDVFEHAHEFTHKYFRGDYAMNAGGEMTAMGAMWYFFDEMGMYNRLRQGSRYSPGQMMLEETAGNIIDVISHGSSYFGDELTSRVPKQKYACEEIEYQVKEYYKKIQESPIYADGNEDERDYCRKWKRSCTLSKMQNLHRYGYHRAAALVPNNYHNQIVIRYFLSLWDDFCKKNEASELHNSFSGIGFKIYRNGEGEIKWKAELISLYPSEISNYTLTEKNISHFSIEDCYVMQDDY
jgi:hypothetical protein